MQRSKVPGRAFSRRSTARAWRLANSHDALFLPNVPELRFVRAANRYAYGVPKQRLAYLDMVNAFNSDNQLVR